MIFLIIYYYMEVVVCSMNYEIKVRVEVMFVFGGIIVELIIVELR